MAREVTREKYLIDRLLEYKYSYSFTREAVSSVALSHEEGWLDVVVDEDTGEDVFPDLVDRATIILTEELEKDGLSVNDEMLFAMRLQLVITKGTAITDEDTHNLWWIWRRSLGFRDHPSMVPFGELSDEEKAKDTVRTKALRNAARRLGV